MYGTVARLKARPDSRAQLEAFGRETETVTTFGRVADYVYQLDGNPDEYYLVALFTSREAYFANANSPEQDARYRTLRALLVADPEWHDGEIIHAYQMRPQATV